MTLKVIIFPTEEQAKQADYKYNNLTGSVSKYHFNRKLLKETTTLTKAEYADIYGITESFEDESGAPIPNPRYEALEDSYTLQKCAGIVGDALDRYDEEGNFLGYFSPYDTEMTTPFDVVEITEDDLFISVEE